MDPSQQQEAASKEANIVAHQKTATLAPKEAMTAMDEEAEQSTPEEGTENPIRIVTEEERRNAEAKRLEGNQHFIASSFEEAFQCYSEALLFLPESDSLAIPLFSNRALCYLKLNRPRDCINDADKVLAIEPTHIKALFRRAAAREQVGEPELALADFKKVAELEPSLASAAEAVRRLEPIVAEKQEREKAEMISKLKDLGNTILGKFGLSTDNFRLKKDEATGSYSINFQQ
eukprot:gnl/Trimastix_PCT/2129.p1 GENE.gnl/Trimastix_PCT/2129~~gnl/Trimastix_PCT/2129.p1  ORF type:complete len:232 (+),score=45.11 gnl/Trimastix_PCT/2129:62-757(+)